MKFAKELEQDLVPEWRAMYLDYKQGKKKVKAVSRAASRANATPRTPAAPNLLPADPPRDTSLYGSTSPFGLRATPRSKRHDDGDNEPVDPLRKSPAPPGVDSRPDTEESMQGAAKKLTKTPPVPIPARPSTSSPDTDTVQYGSFVPTPPKQKRRPQPFELPDPALPTETPLQSPSRAAVVPNKRPSSGHTDRVAAQRVQSMSIPTNAYEVGPTTPPPHRTTLTSLRSRDTSKRPFNVRRMFSIGTPLSSSEAGKLDVDMAVLDQVKMRQKEFFWWMDKELEKVETFYKQKEDEAGERLKVLREQLHVMRNRRIQEVAEAQRDKAIREQAERAIFDFGGKKTRKVANDDDRRPPSRDQVNAWLDPLERRWDEVKAKAFGPRLGQNSKALQDMQRSPELKTNQPPNRNGQIDEGRDYVRRPHHEQDVPYRTAKRKLKMALQEYYRSMELLKSYALLNRTAFRKINKKYDKAVDAHPPLRYMSEKVSKSWFVQSDVLDGHLHAVEDLYARYFEKGNHKVATGKLRSSTGRPGDRSGSAFKNGLLIGTGAVFTIQGIIYGSQLLFHPDPTVRTQTSYLLQIYAGYFFGLYLLAWFCLDCSIWTRHKINYQFVFEFDPRNNLDWRQLAEFPSFFIFLFGLFIWINFSRYGTSEMYIYYPVILLFVTVLIVFMPAPIMYYKSRRWFVYSHWRLLLAGLYPVEFRDFFLGDMYCSLTYSMANIELFFCLYASYWGNPSQCNSTHSRLLGFFTTLPSIWRGLQCIRRYYDTRNAFPHLVNCGKYSMSIMYYMTLSLYRIHRSNNLLALFATFATINAIYSSIWDLFMDWSLLQSQAKKRFLRDVKGFKSTWWYYGAMILDPILRFNWIFYAIYTHDLQHNSIVSFLVGFSEITRRGIWTLFRVENEHCANVARFKASRDVPLPYEIDESSDEELQRQQTALEREPTLGSPALTRTRSTTTGALEAQVSNTSSSLRRRPGIARTLTKIVADAHTQDFEKKRKPGGGESNKLLPRAEMSDDARDGSSDDDDEADEQDMLDAGELIRKTDEDEHNGNGSPSTKRK